MFILQRRESKIIEVWLKKYLAVVCRRMLVLNMGGTKKPAHGNKGMYGK